MSTTAGSAAEGLGDPRLESGLAEPPHEPTELLLARGEHVGGGGWRGRWGWRPRPDKRPCPARRPDALAEREGRGGCGAWPVAPALRSGGGAAAARRGRLEALLQRRRGSRRPVIARGHRARPHHLHSVLMIAVGGSAIPVVVEGRVVVEVRAVPQPRHARSQSLPWAASHLSVARRANSTHQPASLFRAPTCRRAPGSSRPAPAHPTRRPAPAVPQRREARSPSLMACLSAPSSNRGPLHGPKPAFSIRPSVSESCIH